MKPTKRIRLKVGVWLFTYYRSMTFYRPCHTSDISIRSLTIHLMEHKILNLIVVPTAQFFVFIKKVSENEYTNHRQTNCL